MATRKQSAGKAKKAAKATKVSKEQVTTAAKPRFGLEFSIVELQPHLDGSEVAKPVCRWCMGPDLSRSQMNQAIKTVARRLQSPELKK